MKNRRNSELALIHLAKKDLGMDDETYRNVLWMCGRKTSSADLDYAGRSKVIEHMKSCGWRPTSKHKKPNVGVEKRDLIRKIEALLTDQSLSWAYADALAKRMYKKERVQFCAPEELRGVITALVKKREKK